MIGERIREFEIESELGSGGYGVVYRAHDVSVDREVAIKVIRPQYANQADFAKNFEMEARLVAALEHPWVVPLYQYWQDERGAFLVMRLIRGGSLKDLIAKQGTLSLAHTTHLIEQIAQGLQAAHEANIVHRDLKPANILIDERGNAYLTDFGIAKQLTDEKPSSEKNILKGTFSYMSPEQIRSGNIVKQTDIYALGIMLYEMLVGEHPFQELHVGTLIMKQLTEPLPNISDERDDLAPAIDDIIQKATAKDPALRYANALDLVSDLKALVQEPIVTAAPIGTLVAPTPRTTVEARNRSAMLENVSQFWIEGVLENSLHNAAMIELRLNPEAGMFEGPWDTVLQTPSGTERHLDEPIVDVFDRLDGKLLILGDPGSGKTTTLLTLARDLLHRAEVDEQAPIPVVLNLSSWSQDQLPLAEWLVVELRSKYQVPRRVGQRWVEEDDLLLLLDGLDEVTVAVREACVEAINAYQIEHRFVDVVVCSRIVDYDALTARLKLSGAIIIQPLDDDQIADYLDQLGADVQIVRDLIDRDAQLRELAQSPLMLSIMVLAFRGLAADDIPNFEDIEQQRQHLFEVYVERMVGQPNDDAAYTATETRHYLNWLAKAMQSQGKSVFNIEEMQPALLAPAQMPIFTTSLRAVHMLRMFLSLFIAGSLYGTLFQGNFLIYGVGLGLAGVVNGWVFTGPPQRWRNPITHLPFGLVAAGTVAAVLVEGGLSPGEIASATAFGALNSFVSYLIGVGHNQLENNLMSIVPKEQLRLSRRAIEPRIGLVGIVAGVIYIVGFTPLVNPSATLGGYVLAIIASGIVLGFFFVIYSALTSEMIEQRISPNEGMRRSIRNAMRMMLTIAPTFALTGISAIPSITLLTGIITSIGAFFSAAYHTYWTYGGFVYEQHHLLRYLLQREGHIPRNLAAFLDYAATRILMRKVGGGYIFIHRYLLEYFADSDDRPTK